MRGFAAVLAVTACLAAPMARGAGIVANGDFEGNFGPNGVGEGWANDSWSGWGDYDITYARETENPHSGKACQRMTVNRIGYISPTRNSWIGHGAAQFRATAQVALVKGKIYRARIWLRGSGTYPVMNVMVQVRQVNSPWWSYYDQTALVGKTWRKVEFVFTSLADDPNTWFMLKFNELGTLWMDDAALEEISPDEAARIAGPPVAGNLLHNGDFDLGRANWLGDVGWDNVRRPEFTIEDGSTGPCLRVDLAKGQAVSVIGDVVPLTPNAPVFVSCRVRCTEPTVVAFAALFQMANHAQYPWCTAEAKVGSEWTTLQTQGTVGFLPDGTYCFVRITATGPTTLYVDDVQVRQDGQTAPDTRPRAAFVTDRMPLSLYHDGEKVGLRLLSSVPKGAFSRLLNWRVVNYWGEAVLKGSWRPGDGRQEKAIDCKALPRGWYRAEVTWEHAGRPWRDECTFCLLPPRERTDDPDKSPFGGHLMYDTLHMGLAHAVGVRWQRLWPPGITLWSTVEPKKGEWHFNDEAIAKIAHTDGVRIFGMLESYPSWVNFGGDEFWAAWENYVARVVEHYKADIHFWEVLNESDLKWWASKPTGPSRAQNYVEYVRHTYPVIKRVDPTATVVGGGVSGDFSTNTDGLASTEELIDLGALQYMDVLSFHYYHSAQMPMPMDEREDPVVGGVARIKAKMQAAGKVVPIWDSEGGTYNPGPAITYRPPTPDNVDALSGETVALLMTRQYIAQWAAGVERFFYYNMFIGGSPYASCWDSFSEGDGQPRPCAPAYATMTWALQGAKFERTERPDKDQWAHYFSTPRGTVVVAYVRTGTKGKIDLPRATSAWDIMGAPVKIGPGGSIPLAPTPTYILLRK